MNKKAMKLKNWNKMMVVRFIQKPKPEIEKNQIIKIERNLFQICLSLQTIELSKII